MIRFISILIITASASLALYGDPQIEKTERIIKNHVTGMLSGYRGQSDVKLAIVDADEVKNKTGEPHPYLYNIVFKYMFKDGRFRLVEREMIGKIITEQSLQQTGITDSDLASSIGKLSGAQVILIIRKNGNNVDLRIVSVGNGEVLAFTSFLLGRGIPKWARACRPAIQSYCQDVQPGEGARGRIVKCLKNHRSYLTDECKNLLPG